MIIWASTAQEQISTIINPIILEYYQKKNLRSLSSSEYENLEKVKTKALLSLRPFAKIDKGIIDSAFDNSTNASVNTYNNWLKDLKTSFDRDLSVEEIKQAKASFYSEVYS
jgi:hypothetical protein